jgi:hypothetical protein
MATAKKSGSKSMKPASMKPASKKPASKKKPAARAAPQAPLRADELKVTVSAEDRAGWTAAAAALKPAEVSLAMPFAVLTGESVDVARFARARWSQTLDETTKKIVAPGLSSAVLRHLTVAPNALVLALHGGTAQELLTLTALTQEAQTRALLSATSSGGVVHPRFEAEKVAGDLRLATESYLDDGVETDEDARLRAVIDAHANDPARDDALAAELHDFAAFAETLLPVLDGYGDFTPAWIARARDLVAELRVAPAGAAASTRPDGALLDARNRLATLLARRVRRVRAKARFVFRDHPAVLRTVTSAYERNRRAESKRAKKSAAKKTGGPPPSSVRRATASERPPSPTGACFSWAARGWGSTSRRSKCTTPRPTPGAEAPTRGVGARIASRYRRAHDYEPHSL